MSVGNNPKPIDIFSIFFDDVVLSHVVFKTNLYAQSRLNQSNVTRRSKIRKGNHLTVVELRKFLGVCLLIGQIKLPTMYHYFRKKGLYVVPSITKIIFGRRFKSIMRNSHIKEDNQNDR